MSCWCFGKSSQYERNTLFRHPVMAISRATIVAKLSSVVKRLNASKSEFMLKMRCLSAAVYSIGIKYGLLHTTDLTIAMCYRWLYSMCTLSNLVVGDFSLFGLCKC